MRKYVVTSTLSNPEWNNTQVISPDNIAADVARLKDEHDGDVLVNGSAQLVQELTELGLVDEYRLMVFPVLLGKGKRMFADTAEPRPLELKSSKQAGQTRIDTYEPASS